MSTEAPPSPVLISFFYFVRGTKGPHQPDPRLSLAVLSPELHSTLLAPRIPLQAMIWSRSPILYTAFCWIKTTLISIGQGRGGGQEGGSGDSCLVHCCGVFWVFSAGVSLCVFISTGKLQLENF